MRGVLKYLPRYDGWMGRAPNIKVSLLCSRNKPVHIKPLEKMMLTLLLFLMISFYVLETITSIDAFSGSSFPRGTHYRPKQNTRRDLCSIMKLVTPDESSGGETSDSKKIRAALYQAPVQNTALDNSLAVLIQIADSLRVAANHGVDLVVYPELYLSGSTRQVLDRESNELNIVGTICGELGVACTVGYAEKMDESEICTVNDEENILAYNSIAAFNADGSRAGNYRSISASFSFQEGYAFVESIPVIMQLPTRTDEKQRDIKVALMCGKDALSPEHSRQLVRSGAQVLLISASLANIDFDQRIVECVIPSRAVENVVPVLFANPEGGNAGSGGQYEFLGSSAIISKDGSYLACAPQEQDGDLPLDCGYLLPCETGALYAADIDIFSSQHASTTDTIMQSIKQWNLIPRIPDMLEKRDKKLSKELKGTSGFGRKNRKKDKGNLTT